MPKELIGHVSVDSGQVILVDPCYLTNNFNEDDYRAAFEANHKNNRAGEFIPKGMATGVSVASGYGDGCYPAYVTRNKEGRVMTLTVDFR